MRKVSKAVEEAIHAVQEFQQSLEKGTEKFDLTSKKFAHLTYAAKKAAAECELK